MAINWRIWSRKGHRWGAICVAIPFLLVIVTGILLQLKKEWPWIQPTTMRGQGTVPFVTFERLLEAARSSPEAQVESWNDVDRVDVQPRRGIAKIHARNHWEIQVDLASGKVLQVAYRRSDLIESLHDGSWFHHRAKLWLFLPVALLLMALWLTGIYLFFLPYAVRWSRRRNSR